MKRFAHAAVLLSLLGSAALAADKAEEGGQQSVPISPVALPIVVDGKLVNYVFVTVRLDLSPTANTSKLREKEPFFRDALVRAAHRTPFTLPSDLTRIDEAKLKAVFLRDAQAIGGPAVRAVRIESQAPKSTRVASAR